ncbi:MAG: glycosyltransferase family A protein [Methanolobus sp.]
MNLNNFPLVSVIIPTRNRPNDLRRAVKSVLDQTYTNLEIIIVDDFSEMDIRNIINEIQEENGVSIVYIKNTEQLGNAETRNVGIKQAKGDYISFLDDDDEWLNTKIEKQIALILQTGLKVCFCGTIWKENNEILKKTLTQSKTVSFENGGPTSTWLMHKSVFKKIGYFDKTFPANVDGEFLVRINNHFDSCFLEKYLYIHYYYENQITASNNNKIVGFEKMISKHRDIFNSHELCSAYFKLCIFYLFDGKKNYYCIKQSLSNSVNAKNISLLLIMIIPSMNISKFVLNKILDYLKYPQSFAGRYH